MLVSTTRILAMKALERRCEQDCVDWAIGLLERGNRTRNVAILAGMIPPFNPFEMAEMRDRVLEELCVPALAREDAIVIYAGELAADAAEDPRSPYAVLRELSELCIAEGYLRELHECYLLSNAWEDLLSRNEQWYVANATLDNIETLARDELARLAAASLRARSRES
jgi:hypothetical protein